MSRLFLVLLAFAYVLRTSGAQVELETGLSEISSTWEDFVQKEYEDRGHPEHHVAPDIQQSLRQRCKDVKLTWETQPLKQVLIEADVKSKCIPGERPFGDRLVVVARHKENVSWLVTHLAVPFLVYSTTDDEDAAHHRSVNIGNEVGPYLTFIAEYYDCLPDTILFAHAHRFSRVHSMHTLDYDANTAQWNKVPGFAPKHRIGLWHDVDHIRNPDLNWQHPINVTLEEAKTFNCFEIEDNQLVQKGVAEMKKREAEMNKKGGKQQ